MTMTLRAPVQGWVDAHIPIATTPGGAGGRRVVTAAFELRGLRLPRVTLAADLDAATFRDESAVRRRGARALVAFGKQIGNGILAGRVPIEAEWTGNGWHRFSCWERMEYEGLERRAAGRIERRPALENQPPVVTPEYVKALGKAFVDLATALHVAVDDPYNAPAFGKP